MITAQRAFPLRGWLIALATLCACGAIAAWWLRTPAPTETVLHDGRSVAAWALDLQSGSASVREAAKNAVRAMDTNALPDLVLLLRTRDRVWGRPVDVLARGLPAKVGTKLRQVFRPDEAGRRRASAAEALRLMGESARPALPALGDALHDRSIAAWHAAMALSQFGEEGERRLLQALAAKHARVRSFACHALSSRGASASNAAPALAVLLADPSPGIREQASEALARIGRAAVPHLVQALAHPEPEPRIRAIRALGSMGPLAADGVPDLLQLLRSDDLPVRLATVDALANIRPTAPAVVDGLRAALVDPSEAVRLKAIMGLGRMPSRSVSAAPAIADLLSDPSPQVRLQAVGLLGEMGTAAEPALPALREALHDEDLIVRAKAREALRKSERQIQGRVADGALSAQEHVNQRHLP